MIKDYSDDKNEIYDEEISEIIEDDNFMYAIKIFISVVICIIIFLLIVLFPKVAHAGEINSIDFINTIIGEAEGSQEDMLWVASTIRNRGSLRGTYGMKSKRVKNHLYSLKTFVQAVKAYEESSKKDITGGCMFWFSDQDLKQKSVKRIIKMEKLVFVKRLGSKKYGNNFYKKG